jgi:hypothetical protein
MPALHRPFAGHPVATSHPRLIAQAQTFLALAIGDNTRRTYAAGVNSYLAFTASHRISAPFPAGVETLCLWVTWLAQRRRTFATCKVYLAAVVNRHAEMGLPHPLMGAATILERTLAGVKRASANASKPKLPITTAMLRSMRPHLRLQQRRDALLWAMMWTATAGLLRISEFTGTANGDTDRLLRMQQLTLFDSDGTAYSMQQLRAAAAPRAALRYASLHLNASKTDPFRTGVDVIIAAPAALIALCAYAALCSAVHVLPTAPLFAFEDGPPISRRWLMAQVDDLLRSINCDPRAYSSHSFRKGGAVSLQELGVEDSIIRRTGRWRSDAFHLYVRDASTDSLIAACTRL